MDFFFPWLVVFHPHLCKTILRVWRASLPIYLCHQWYPFPKNLFFGLTIHSCSLSFPIATVNLKRWSSFSPLVEVYHLKQPLLEGKLNIMIGEVLYQVCSVMAKEIGDQVLAELETSLFQHSSSTIWQTPLAIMKSPIMRTKWKVGAPPKRKKTLEDIKNGLQTTFNDKMQS